MSVLLCMHVRYSCMCTRGHPTKCKEKYISIRTYATIACTHTYVHTGTHNHLSIRCPKNCVTTPYPKLYPLVYEVYVCIHSPLTFHIVVRNVVSVQVGQCLESAPEDVFGVVHHQLQHGGVILVLHQEVGEGSVAHLGQVALQVTTHAGHEVVAEVAGGSLGVLLTHHHCRELNNALMPNSAEYSYFRTPVVSLLEEENAIHMKMCV